jgi:hypothetical protein
VRRAVVLAMLVALGAAAPADAARPACGKRLACKGKVRAARTGVPPAWAKRAPLVPAPPTPGRDDVAPGDTPRRDGPAPPPLPPALEDDPRYLQVVAWDSDPERWLLLPSRGTLLSGTVEVEFNNRYAEDPHDLRITRGGTIHRFDVVENGDAATMRVPLAAGTWRLWCSLDGHADLGMDTEVTVVDG